MAKISEGVKTLIDNLLIYPWDWCQGEYKIANSKSGISIWTANGAEYLDINGAKVFNDREKKEIWKAIKEVNCMNTFRNY